MAPGPLPKPKEQRARRNTPARGEWTDLAPITEPILPDLKGASKFHYRTRQLWKGWQKDPATRLFGESEIAMCIEAAYIHSALVSGTPGLTWQVFTGWMDRLGLTPKGKRDLRLKVVAADAAPVLRIV